MSYQERRYSLEKTNSIVPVNEGRKSPGPLQKPEYESIGETFKRNRSGSSGSLLLSLPTLFNNLRTGERKDSDSSTDGSSILHKIFSSKDKDVDLPPTSRRGSNTKSPRNSISKVKSNEDLEVDIFENVGRIKIPSVFVEDGLSLLKISQKSKKRIFFQIDPSDLTFTWRVASKSQGQVPASSSLQGLKGYLSSTIHFSKLYKFSIDDVKKVLFQLDARYYRDELNISKELEKQWISLSYYDHVKNKIKTLHLIGDTEFDVKRFYTLINNLKKLRDELSEKFYIDFDNMDDEQREFVANKTVSSSKTSKEYLSFEDIVKYTGRLNININTGYLRSIFDQLDCKFAINDVPVLNFEGFKQFIALLKRRNDIDEIWNSICPPGQQTLNYKFIRFKIEDIQHEEITEKVFEKFCTVGTNEWNSESLNQFLLSKYCRPTYEGVQDDEYYSKPLNEYFISSSHNTYLTGRQIIDESSSEGYVRALQKGCRSVEIDIWDGTDDETDEIIPVVKHGRVFTSEIKFEHVLMTIKKYAFVASPLPLILSLEINCSSLAQTKIVQLLFEIIGDLLAIEPLNNLGVLPSPSELKNKILVKAKKTSPTESYYLNENGTFSSSTTSMSEDSLSSVNSNSSSTLSPSKPKKTKSKQVIDELSSMAIYVQGIRFRNFSLPESKTFNHCFSLNEKAIDSMLNNESQRKAVDKHNRRFIMRVYPHKMRLTSTNFNPIKYWTHGVQMVATNWQTYDLGQQINEALFDGMNKYGYVLKPKDIRKPLLKQTMRNLLNFETKTTHFNFKIISGHQLPKLNQTFNINPFVKVEIIGAEEVNYETNQTKTSVINENGFNPIWNESFSGTLKSNELVFIKFIVCTSTKDEDSVLGVYVCKLDYLRKGYRYLPLNDTIGEKLIYSSLFVHIDYHQTS